MQRPPLPPDEAARLESLRSLEVLDSLPEAQYDDIAYLAATICGTPIALVSLVDEGRQWFKARVGLDAEQTPRDISFCGHAILDPSQTFVVNDAKGDARFATNPLVTGAPDIRFYAGAPLRSPTGHALGTLCVIDRVARNLSEGQLRSLEALGRQVTQLLALRSRTAELEAANRQLREQKARLQEVTHDLNESVTRFRSTFDQNAIGLIITSNDGRFLTVNRAFAEMLGYTESELVGLHATEVTHPDDIAETRSRIASPSSELINVAKRFVRKDGEVIWTESVARMLLDEHGRPLYWLSQVQNVTARKESEERLAAQYEMARVLAEASTLEASAPRMLETLCATGRWDLAVIWEIDEREAVLRCAAVKSVLPDAGEAVDHLRKMVARRGEGIAGRAWVSGRSTWVEDVARSDVPGIVAKGATLGMRSVLSVPVLVEGKPIGVVNLFTRAPRVLDAATQSLAEALCAQMGSFLTRKRAEAMQLRMVAVLEHTSDCVIITDRRGTPLYVNRAGRAMLEVPADADPQGYKSVDFVPPWAAKILVGELFETAKRDGRWTGDFAYLTRSGREVPVSQVTIAPKGPDGETLFFASIARDITEAKKVARMKNEFISTVSHELRTPLTSIRGALGLLEGGVLGPLEGSTLEIVRIARTNSERLIRLVNDMLDLEKIEAGKLEMDVRDVGIDSLTASAIDSVRGMAEQAGIALATAIEPGLRGRADVDRVVQVLTNLLSNAVKFSPRGGAVTLRASARGPRVRFEVADEGPGIAPELRARLFQKFQQLDASDTRAKGGTGLGLSISKAIVEQLGGSIGVDSTSGHGATFWFELSRVVGALPQPSPPPSAAKILIVDDDPSIRAILTRLFATLGVRVLHASDGAHGLHLARTEAPDLIVLDLGMPRPDGFEVVSILQDEAARSTALLVFTARELSAADRETLRLGDTRYLTKSRASESTLLTTVRALLGRPEAKGSV